MLVLEQGQRDGLLQQGDGSMGRFCSQTGGHQWGRGRHWCKRVGKQLHVNPSLLLGPAVCLHTHKERAAQSQEREIF